MTDGNDVAAASRDRTDEPLTFSMVPSPSAGSFDASLEAAGREVAGLLSPPALLEVTRGESLPILPALRVVSPEHGEKARYHAVPEGLERQPFEDGCRALAAGQADVELVALLSGLAARVELVVLVSPSCPHCPSAVSEAWRLVAASRRVSLVVIDAERFPEVALKLGALSVPYTCVGELELTGVVPATDLGEALADLSGPKAAALRLRGLLDAGRFGDAAAGIASGWAVGPYAAGWAASTMTERIRLMLLAEEAIAARREAMDGLVAHLVPSLGAGDDALRGDTADLLGKIGHPAARAPLEALAGDPNEDVREVVEEALEAIREREQGG